MIDTQYFETRAKAFSCESVRTHKVSVDVEGVVRVYDPVAKYYSTCHSLSPRAVRRIRADAGYQADES